MNHYAMTVKDNALMLTAQLGPLIATAEKHANWKIIHGIIDRVEDLCTQLQEASYLTDAANIRDMLAPFKWARERRQ